MATLYIEVGFPITYPRSLSELILIYLSVPKLHYFSVVYVIWVLFLCLKVLLFENSNSYQHTPPPSTEPAQSFHPIELPRSWDLEEQTTLPRTSVVSLILSPHTANTTWKGWFLSLKPMLITFFHLLCLSLPPPQFITTSSWHLLKSLAESSFANQGYPEHFSMTIVFMVSGFVWDGSNPEKPLLSRSL